MKNTPKGWPRVTSAIYYDDAAAAIDWLCRAFGFEVRLKVEGDKGRIEHSELVIGDGVVMVASSSTDAQPEPQFKAHRNSPKSLGGANTQSLMVYVDDAEAHYERAKATGAKIFMEPAVHDYGEDHWADRSYGAVDPEGHHWWFTQRLRDPKS